MNVVLDWIISSSIRWLLWLCLCMELYILPFKENRKCQDSNENFNSRIEFKFNWIFSFEIMMYKIMKTQKFIYNTILWHKPKFKLFCFIYIIGYLHFKNIYIIDYLKIKKNSFFSPCSRNQFEVSTYLDYRVVWEHYLEELISRKKKVGTSDQNIYYTFIF